MTEAEFLRRLRHGGTQLAVLAEIEYARESGGALVTGTLYFSDVDDPVSGTQRYYSAIEGAPELERAIDLTQLGGRGSRTIGAIKIINTDGAFSWLLDVIIDGRDAAIYLGVQGSVRSDFRLIYKGAVASVSAPDDDTIVISLRDKTFLLDATVIGDVIATGPNAGKPRPICFGTVKNLDVTPYLLDAAALKYYINNFAMALSFSSAVLDVRDAGASLDSGQLFEFDGSTMTANAGTDTLTRTTAHGLEVNDVIYLQQVTASDTIFAGLTFATQYWVIAAGFTTTDFRLSLTKGGAAVDITGTTMSGSVRLFRRRFYVNLSAATIELSASPSGRVTVDMQAQKVEAQNEPHRVFLHLLQNYTKLTSAEYDTAAINALAELFSADMAASIAILDRENVIDLLDAISRATDSWYAWGVDGVLTVGRLDLHNISGAAAVDEIDTDDLIEGGHISAENLPLPWGKVVVDHTPNVVVQTDGLVTSVSAANRTLWGQKYQGRVSTTDPGTAGYLANWWDYHKSAIDSAPMGLRATSSQFLVDDTTALFRPWTRVHRCTVGIDHYALDPGDCVTVTYPRYGLESGAKCRVVSVRPQVSKRVVDLVLVRQVTPDYTTVR